MTVETQTGKFVIGQGSAYQEGKLEKIKILKEELKGQIDDITEEIENTQNLRFPKLEPKNRSIEDSVRCFSSLGESERSEKDRSFDDLTRLYFVAFSRAENVLLLIGLLPSLDGYAVNNNLKQIPNVALGWNRDEQLVGFDEIYLI